jgi:hypothetical protein
VSGFNEDLIIRPTMHIYLYIYTYICIFVYKYLFIQTNIYIYKYIYVGESGFNEDLISRNLRPTMPQLLELNRLTINHDLERLATVGRNSQLYLGREKGSGIDIFLYLCLSGWSIWNHMV